MQFQQLAYFTAVADCGSFNKAAEAMFISQPSLSKAIGNLEAELGLELFSRNNRGVQLTEDGKKLYQYARSILEQMEMVRNMSRRDLPRILSVSAFPGLTSSRLLRVLYERYTQQRIRFSLVEGRISEIVENIRTLKSELGIIHINNIQHKEVRNLLESRDMEFHELSRDTWYAYLGPNSPLFHKEQVTMAELFQYTVLRPPDDYFALLTSYLTIDGVSLTDTPRVMFLNNEGAIMNLLCTTDAFHFGMSWSRERYEALGLACKPIVNCDVEITLGWVKRKKEKLSMEAEEFVRMLEQQYGEKSTM